MIGRRPLAVPAANRPSSIARCPLAPKSRTDRQAATVLLPKRMRPSSYCNPSCGIVGRSFRHRWGTRCRRFTPAGCLRRAARETPNVTPAATGPE